MVYKTLVTTDDVIINSVGRYVHIVNGCLGFSLMPNLMKKEIDIETLKGYWPTIDFDGLELLEVELKEL